MKKMKKTAQSEYNEIGFHFSPILPTLFELFSDELKSYGQSIKELDSSIRSIASGKASINGTDQSMEKILSAAEKAYANKDYMLASAELSKFYYRLAEIGQKGSEFSIKLDSDSYLNQFRRSVNEELSNKRDFEQSETVRNFLGKQSQQQFGITKKADLSSFIQTVSQSFVLKFMFGSVFNRLISMDPNWKKFQVNLKTQLSKAKSDEKRIRSLFGALKTSVKSKEYSDYIKTYDILNNQINKVVGDFNEFKVSTVDPVVASLPPDQSQQFASKVSETVLKQEKAQKATAVIVTNEVSINRALNEGKTPKEVATEIIQKAEKEPDPESKIIDLIAINNLTVENGLTQKDKVELKPSLEKALPQGELDIGLKLDESLTQLTDSFEVDNKVVLPTERVESNDIVESASEPTPTVEDVPAEFIESVPEIQEVSAPEPEPVQEFDPATFVLNISELCKSIVNSSNDEVILSKIKQIPALMDNVLKLNLDSVQKQLISVSLKSLYSKGTGLFLSTSFDTRANTVKAELPFQKEISAALSLCNAAITYKEQFSLKLQSEQRVVKLIDLFGVKDQNLIVSFNPQSTNIKEKLGEDAKFLFKQKIVVEATELNPFLKMIKDGDFKVAFESFINLVKQRIEAEKTSQIGTTGSVGSFLNKLSSFINKKEFKEEDVVSFINTLYTFKFRKHPDKSIFSQNFFEEVERIKRESSLKDVVVDIKPKKQKPKLTTLVDYISSLFSEPVSDVDTSELSNRLLLLDQLSAYISESDQKDEAIKNTVKTLYGKNDVDGFVENLTKLLDLGSLSEFLSKHPSHKYYYDKVSKSVNKLLESMFVQKPVEDKYDLSFDDEELKTDISKFNLYISISDLSDNDIVLSEKWLDDLLEISQLLTSDEGYKGKDGIELISSILLSGEDVSDADDLSKHLSDSVLSEAELAAIKDKTKDTFSSASLSEKFNSQVQEIQQVLFLISEKLKTSIIEVKQEEIPSIVEAPSTIESPVDQPKVVRKRKMVDIKEPDSINPIDAKEVVTKQDVTQDVSMDFALPSFISAIENKIDFSRVKQLVVFYKSLSDLYQKIETTIPLNDSLIKELNMFLFGKQLNAADFMAEIYKLRLSKVNSESISKVLSKYHSELEKNDPENFQALSEVLNLAKTARTIPGKFNNLILDINSLYSDKVENGVIGPDGLIVKGQFKESEMFIFDMFSKTAKSLFNLKQSLKMKRKAKLNDKLKQLLNKHSKYDV